MERESLLRTAAREIDDLDGQIANLNEDKKAIYQNIKETVPPAEFRAWREAVKLRQKRRTDREKMDAHDRLVADMLHMLERAGTVHAIARVQAHEAAPAHDHETGEIIDETPAADLAVPAAGEEGGGSPPVTPPSTLSDTGPMPAFLDRRVKAEEAATC